MPARPARQRGQTGHPPEARRRHPVARRVPPPRSALGPTPGGRGRRRGVGTGPGLTWAALAAALAPGPARAAGSPRLAHLAPAPHSPARTAPAASPGAGRRRLCRSPAGQRGAGDSAPLLPPPHLRRVPPLRLSSSPPPASPPSGSAAAAPRPPPRRAALAKVRVRAPPGPLSHRPGPAPPRQGASPRAPLGPAPRLHPQPPRGAGSGGPAAAGTPPRRPPGAPPRASALPPAGRTGGPAGAGCAAPKSGPGPEVRPRTGQWRRAGVGAALRLPMPRDPAGRAPGAERAPSPGHRRTLTRHTLAPARPRWRVETAVGFARELEMREGREPQPCLRRCVCVNTHTHEGGIPNKSNIAIKSGGPSIRFTWLETKRKNPRLLSAFFFSSLGARRSQVFHGACDSPGRALLSY